MSILYEDGLFKMITSPYSQHGRLIRERGRASLTIHHEQNEPELITQWYVFAEGPVRFTEDDPEPLLRKILRKDRGPEHLEEWTEKAMVSVEPVAVLDPIRLSGYWGANELSAKRRSSD